MRKFTPLRESFARCSAEAPEGKRQMRRYAQIESCCGGIAALRRYLFLNGKSLHGEAVQRE